MARAMKASGNEWIGEIPEEWESKRLKYLVSYNDESLGEDTNPDYEFDYIDIGSVEYGKGITQYQHMRFADSPSRARRVVHDKDVILSTVRTYLKAVATIDVRDNPQIASTGFVALRAKQGQITPDYLHYSVLSNAFVSIVEAKSTGISYPAINASEVVEIKIPVPKISEQKRIADYLNAECAKIDTVIEQTRASIEEYRKLKQSVITQAVTKGIRPGRKMKDSRVEWVGEIPDEWSTPKMGSICTVITDYVASGSFASLAENVEYLDEPDYAMLVRTADVSNKGYSLKPVYINKHAYDYLHNSNLYGGEILLPNIGASVGDVYLVPILYERMSLAPNAIMLKTKYHDKFYYYYFLSKPGRLSIEDIAQSTAQAKFNKTDFRQIRVVLPSDDEQREIAEYLDKKTKEIDLLVQTKNQIITELESFKKSLIFEYVTGKKEVKV